MCSAERVHCASAARAIVAAPSTGTGTYLGAQSPFLVRRRSCEASGDGCGLRGACAPFFGKAHVNTDCSCNASFALRLHMACAYPRTAPYGLLHEQTHVGRTECISLSAPEHCLRSCHHMRAYGRGLWLTRSQEMSATHSDTQASRARLSGAHVASPLKGVTSRTGWLIVLPLALRVQRRVLCRLWLFRRFR